MKLNNKGFAITGILYTVFILFLMILLSVLSGLNIKRQLLEKNMSNIKEELEEECREISETITAIDYITEYQGKYTIKLNNGYEYETYLSKGKTLTTEVLKELTYIGITNNPTDFTDATITKICTTDTIE